MNIVSGQGWPDMVMLDPSKVDENGFMENLILRFKQKQIYTYIGEQVVVMNPYTKLPIYGKEYMEKYKNQYLYEVQPHVYAVGDDTFRMLRQRRRDQCVIVTGESGAGKTEAAKTFMEYLAFVCPGAKDADVIKQKLLDSNPVLEAFGNAKTQRNDNSSRFGKYMEIQFDGAGKPLGGAIKQYLLEKSRVVSRADEERSFHIFYQLLSHKDICQKIGIGSDPASYSYLNSSNCLTVDGMNEASEFKQVLSAMNVLGFSEVSREAVWRVLGGILNLGDLSFEKLESKSGPSGIDACKVGNRSVLDLVCKCMGWNPDDVERCLVTRQITTGVSRRQSSVTIFHNEAAAINTRDSLAKALYNAIFSFVTVTVNTSISSLNKKAQDAVVGILDIYGFEIFTANGFEQFCINYCNEKLQQLFIKLVLRMEQEEYVREGIEWKKIDYFDNEPIVALIDGPSGLYKLIDEACMIGSSTPESLLEKFDQNIKSDRYASAQQKPKEKIAKGVFRIVHYAGDVDYEVALFIVKNQDTLFQDLCQLVHTTTIQGGELLKPYFALLGAGDRKKRPKTASTQFTDDLAVLVHTLEKCQPHYIRCIKPNEKKQSFGLNEERTRLQVKYLNLVETVKVRKAGFCNRQLYERFFPRYKCIMPGAWYHYSGSNKQGALDVMQHLGISAEEYRSGHTQIFIRSVQTLMKLEETRVKEMPKVAIAIQRRWKGYKARLAFKRLHAAWKIQRFVRGVLARRAVRPVKAAAVLQRAIRSFTARQEKQTLWKTEMGRRLLIKQNKAAIKIQKVARGRQGRKWVTENKRIMADERAKLEAAKMLQKWSRRLLVNDFMKQLGQTFCQVEKTPPPRYGKLLPWPKAVGSSAKSISVVLQKIRTRQWAFKMVRYHEALSVIQKAYRSRLRRTYVKESVKAFSFSTPRGKDKRGKGLYVAPKFGKQTAFPKAITATTKVMDPILKKMRKAWWGYQLIRWLRATELIQKKYRKRLDYLYVKHALKSVQDDMKNNFSKEAKLPHPISPGPKAIHKSIVRMHHEDWGRRKCLSLTKDERGRVHQKMAGMNIFRGKTGWSRPYGYDFTKWKLNADWDCKRPWKTDYVTGSGGAAERYGEVCQEMFTRFGDTTVVFTDVLVKVNRKGVMQNQVIIVTDKNIYKYDAKSFKMIKVGIPLSQCKAIHKSPHKDTYIILEFESPYRDMVLNCGSHNCERFSELATVVSGVVEELTDKTIPVTFPTSLTYNNSRTDKSPGQNVTLTWHVATEKDKWKPEQFGNCIFKSVSKAEAHIIYNN